MDQHSEQVVKSTEVIGQAVRNHQGESLGKIEEIVLDKLSGQVRYVVLSFGGMMGLGDKYFAFPWKSISYDAAQSCFILNVDKANLKEANGFNKDSWPDMSQRVWQQSIATAYPY